MLYILCFHSVFTFIYPTSALSIGNNEFIFYLTDFLDSDHKACLFRPQSMFVMFQCVFRKFFLF